MSKITESEIERYTIEELENLGYQFLYGPDISCDGLFSERQSYTDIILAGRLRAAVQKLNPAIPANAQEQAVQKVLPRRIFEKAEERFVDAETGHVIAVMKAVIYSRERDIMVAYKHDDVDVKLLTIHPLKEGQKENRIQSGRWRKI